LPNARGRRNSISASFTCTPIQSVGRNFAVFREQAQRRRPLLGFIKNFQRLPPGRLLAIVDLSQKQDLPLHHPPRAHPAILHHAEIAVGLAVLASLFAAQKHPQHASSQIHGALVKRVGRHYNGFS
jgi:hypothetical protein